MNKDAFILMFGVLLLTTATTLAYHWEFAGYQNCEDAVVVGNVMLSEDCANRCKSSEASSAFCFSIRCYCVHEDLGLLTYLLKAFRQFISKQKENLPYRRRRLLPTTE